MPLCVDCGIASAYDCHKDNHDCHQDINRRLHMWESDSDWIE